MPAKAYRHRATPITALQFDGRNQAAIIAFCPGAIPTPEHTAMTIPNEHGALQANPGTYVIKGPEGDYWVATNDYFHLHYEEAPHERAAKPHKSSAARTSHKPGSAATRRKRTRKPR